MGGSIFVIDNTRDENIEQQGVQTGNSWTTRKGKRKNLKNLSARKPLDGRFILIFQNWYRLDWMRKILWHDEWFSCHCSANKRMVQNWNCSCLQIKPGSSSLFSKYGPQIFPNDSRRLGCVDTSPESLGLVIISNWTCLSMECRETFTQRFDIVIWTLGQGFACNVIDTRFLRWAEGHL